MYTTFLLLFTRSKICSVRQEATPIVVQCADGCGRSGTLVLVEIMLMQLLRGSCDFANPMLTAGVFLRLQRRQAIGSNMQFLFAYRAVLHWCQPYVLSVWNRSFLGFYYFNSGFCGKYNEMAALRARKIKTPRS